MHTNRFTRFRCNQYFNTSTIQIKATYNHTREFSYYQIQPTCRKCKCYRVLISEIIIIKIIFRISFDLTKSKNPAKSCQIIDRPWKKRHSKRSSVSPLLYKFRRLIYHIWKWSELHIHVRISIIHSEFWTKMPNSKL